MSKGFERKTNADGSTNTKYVDLLDEDKPLSGQKFVCVSFVSPENILKQKNMFYFENFLKHFDFEKSSKKFLQFLNFLSYKYGLKFEDVVKEYQDFVKEEKDKLLETTIEDDYKNFLDTYEEQLDTEFNRVHNFQTSTRGLKVRGSFSTQEEAELRCKMLREIDPNHNVYVGPVGTWMPWEPEAYKTGRVEYLEEELNQIMHEKERNEKQAKQEFDSRVKETKQRAIEENMKNAEKSGNKLTQMLNEQGELVGVTGTNTIESALSSNDVVTSADIRKELFEGENVVMKDNKTRVHKK
jgi:hypothetical protein